MKPTGFAYLSGEITPAWEWRWVGYICLIGLGLRLGLCWQSLETLMTSGFLIDDAYYAFSFAREFAQGHPFQVGPGQISNGFQPLYVALITPAFYFAEPGSEVPIRFALGLSVLCSMATAVLIFVWTKRLLGDGIGLMAPLLWALSPRVVAESLNGLETALNLCILAAIGAFWPWLKARPFVLGLSLATAILARVDNILLIPALMAGSLIGRARRAEQMSFSFWSIAACGLILGLLPFAAASWHYTGHIFPTSGSATRHVIQYYLGKDASWIFGADDIFVNLGLTLAVLAQETIQHLFPVPSNWHLGWDSALLLLLLAGLGTFFARRSLDLRWRRHDALIWAIPLILLFCTAYAFFVGPWFLPRHLHGILLLLTLALAWFAGPVLLRELGRALHLFIPLLVLGYSGLSILTLGNKLYPVAYYVDLVRYVDLQLAEGERVGSANSGLLGYHSRGQVINLDGVVNPDAAEALAEGRIDRYMREQRLTQIVDGWESPADLIKKRSHPMAFKLRTLENQLLPLAPLGLYNWRFVAMGIQWYPEPEELERQRQRIPGGQVLLPDHWAFDAGRGWGELEVSSDGTQFYRWTIGDHQILRWPGPSEAGAYRLVLSMYRPRALPEELISIEYLLPGAEVWETLTVGQGNLTIEGKIEVEQGRQLLSIELKMPTWIPADSIPDSDDPRSLGCMLMNLELHPIDGP